MFQPETTGQFTYFVFDLALTELVTQPENAMVWLDLIHNLWTELSELSP